MPMHEGAVCSEIMDIVSHAAAVNGMKQVEEIVLSVGPYSCLHLDQLNFYFEVARKGTCMEHAVITMERDESYKGLSQMFVKTIRGE